MNRRSFLKYTACGLAGAAVGGLATTLHRRDAVSLSAGLDMTAALAAPDDKKYFFAMRDLSTEQLLAALADVGVYSRGRFYPEKIAADAKRHRIVEFRGFYYTEPELMFYALSARLRKSR